MLTLLEAVLLGVVQGITEWLPVSSSGHLVILQEIFGLEADLAFDVMLHLATLIVILAVFRMEIAAILNALIKRDWKSEEVRFLLFIIAGSIPTGLIGYVFHDILASFFTNLSVVGVSMLVTGSIIFASRYRKSNYDLDTKRSVLIGITQGLAIIPGISRSGITIGTGILSGLERETAVRYSFLLSIPVVIGAALSEAGSIAWDHSIYSMLAGMIAAAVVGYLSLRLLIRLVIQKKFYLFSIYCWVAGIVVLVFSLV